MDGAFHRQLARVCRREINQAAGVLHPGARFIAGGVVQIQRNGLIHPVLSKQVQSERITVENDDILSYAPEEKQMPGVYICAKPLQPDSNDYFEIEVLDCGSSGTNGSDIAVGLVPYNHPLDQLPGFVAGSVGYHAADGRIYLGHQRGTVVANRCEVGDRIGCGVRLENSSSSSSSPMPLPWAKQQQQHGPGKANMLPLLPFMKLKIFFTLNGNEVELFIMHFVNLDLI